MAMKFNPKAELGRSVEYTAKTMQRSASQKLTSGVRKVCNMLGIKPLSRQISQDMKLIGKDKTMFQPSSLKDYLDFGQIYISKVLLVVILLVILVAVVVAVRVVYPMILSSFFTRDLPITSSEIPGYNGKVRLLTSDGTVLFREVRY